MKRFHLIASFVILALLWGCVEKDNLEPTPDPTPKAPTVITLSRTSVEVTAVGGRKKGHRQIEDVPNGYIVKDDTEFGYMNVIPLWHFGLNY